VLLLLASWKNSDSKMDLKKMKKLFVALCLMFVLTACTKAPVEKTQDPAEIEKLREKHQSMAEREKADG